MNSHNEALINEVVKVIGDLESEVSNLRGDIEYEREYSCGLHSDLADAESELERLREIMKKAYQAIRDGESEEAEAMIGSFLHPKWHSLEQCQKAYDQEMGR